MEQWTLEQWTLLTLRSILHFLLLPVSPAHGKLAEQWRNGHWKMDNPHIAVYSPLSIVPVSSARGKMAEQWSSGDWNNHPALIAI